MEDKLSILLSILCVAPLVVLAWGVWKEYARYIIERKAEIVRLANATVHSTEYESIQNATMNLEYDFQPNSGEHYPEEVYLKRAEFIRKETSWYGLVNSL